MIYDFVAFSGRRQLKDHLQKNQQLQRILSRRKPNSADLTASDIDACIGEILSYRAECTDVYVDLNLILSDLCAVYQVFNLRSIMCANLFQASHFTCYAEYQEHVLSQLKTLSEHYRVLLELDNCINFYLTKENLTTIFELENHLKSVFKVDTLLKLNIGSFYANPLVLSSFSHFYEYPDAQDLYISQSDAFEVFLEAIKVFFKNDMSMLLRCDSVFAEEKTLKNNNVNQVVTIFNKLICKRYKFVGGHFTGLGVYLNRPEEFIEYFAKSLSKGLEPLICNRDLCIQNALEKIKKSVYTKRSSLTFPVDKKLHGLLEKPNLFDFLTAIIDFLVEINAVVDEGLQKILLQIRTVFDNFGKIGEEKTRSFVVEVFKLSVLKLYLNEFDFIKVKRDFVKLFKRNEQQNEQENEQKKENEKQEVCENSDKEIDMSAFFESLFKVNQNSMNSGEFLLQVQYFMSNNSLVNKSLLKQFNEFFVVLKKTLCEKFFFLKNCNCKNENCIFNDLPLNCANSCNFSNANTCATLQQQFPETLVFDEKCFFNNDFKNISDLFYQFLLYSDFNQTKFEQQCSFKRTAHFKNAILVYHADGKVDQLKKDPNDNSFDTLVDLTNSNEYNLYDNLNRFYALFMFLLTKSTNNNFENFDSSFFCSLFDQIFDNKNTDSNVFNIFLYTFILMLPKYLACFLIKNTPTLSTFINESLFITTSFVQQQRLDDPTYLNEQTASTTTSTTTNYDTNCTDNVVDRLRMEFFNLDLVTVQAHSNRQLIDMAQNRFLKQHIEREARSLQHLSLNMYSQPYQAVYELIQNADDSYSPSRAQLENMFAFHFFDNTLYFVNYEPRGFSDHDVRAICDIGLSTKLQKNLIGRKGIGFKSVFLLSDAPEVHSHEHHFRFDVATDGLIGMLIPSVCPPLRHVELSNLTDSKITHHRQAMLTCFRLPLNRKMSSRALVKVVHDSMRLNNEYLLFLNNINAGKFRVRGSNFKFKDKEARDYDLGIRRRVITTLFERQDKNSHKQSKIQIMCLESFENQNENMNEGESVVGDGKYYILSELRKGAINASVGFQIDGSVKDAIIKKEGCRGNFLRSSNYPLFSYLPVINLNVPFLLHGNFELVSSREQINFGEKSVNRSVLDLAGDALVNFYKELVLRKDLYSYELQMGFLSAVYNDSVKSFQSYSGLNDILYAKFKNLFYANMGALLPAGAPSLKGSAPKSYAGRKFNEKRPFRYFDSFISDKVDFLPGDMLLLESEFQKVLLAPENLNARAFLHRLDLISLLTLPSVFDFYLAELYKDERNKKMFDGLFCFIKVCDERSLLVSFLSEFESLFKLPIFVNLAEYENCHYKKEPIDFVNIYDKMMNKKGEKVFLFCENTKKLELLLNLSRFNFLDINKKNFYIVNSDLVGNNMKDLVGYLKNIDNVVFCEHSDIFEFISKDTFTSDRFNTDAKKSALVRFLYDFYINQNDLYRKTVIEKKLFQGVHPKKFLPVTNPKGLQNSRIYFDRECLPLKRCANNFCILAEEMQSIDANVNIVKMFFNETFNVESTFKKSLDLVCMCRDPTKPESILKNAICNDNDTMVRLLDKNKQQVNLVLLKRLDKDFDRNKIFVSESCECVFKKLRQTDWLVDSSINLHDQQLVVVFNREEEILKMLPERFKKFVLPFEVNNVPLLNLLNIGSFKFCQDLYGLYKKLMSLYYIYFEGVTENLLNLGEMFQVYHHMNEIYKRFPELKNIFGDGIKYLYFDNRLYSEEQVFHLKDRHKQKMYDMYAEYSEMSNFFDGELLSFLSNFGRISKRSLNEPAIKSEQMELMRHHDNNFETFFANESDNLNKNRVKFISDDRLDEMITNVKKTLLYKNNLDQLKIIADQVATCRFEFCMGLVFEKLNQAIKLPGHQTSKAQNQISLPQNYLQNYFLDKISYYYIFARFSRMKKQHTCHLLDFYSLHKRFAANSPDRLWLVETMFALYANNIFPYSTTVADPKGEFRLDRSKLQMLEAYAFSGGRDDCKRKLISMLEKLTNNKVKMNIFHLKVLNEYTALDRGKVQPMRYTKMFANERNALFCMPDEENNSVSLFFNIFSYRKQPRRMFNLCAYIYYSFYDITSKKVAIDQLPAFFEEKFLQKLDNNEEYLLDLFDMKRTNIQAMARVGLESEQAFHRILKRRMQFQGHRLIAVDWVNEEYETGLPYDFKLVTTTEETLFVELKSSSSRRTPENNYFNISMNELNFSRHCQKNHYTVFGLLTRKFKDGERADSEFQVLHVFGQIDNLISRSANIELVVKWTGLAPNATNDDF